MNRLLKPTLIALLSGVIISCFSFFISKNGDKALECASPQQGVVMMTELSVTVLYQKEHGFPFTYYAENSTGNSTACASGDASADNIPSSFNVVAFLDNIVVWSLISGAVFFVYSVAKGLKKQK